MYILLKEAPQIKMAAIYSSCIAHIKKKHYQIFFGKNCALENISK
jgi:hypothetical protein